MSASKHAVNEKQLFHGTNPEIVEAICKQNFDWRLHGKNATKYGEGSYFALNSSYSDAYATEDVNSSKFMFVAKVLVGSYTVGQSSYRRPPQKDPGNPASDLYDSCVDDRWSPTIFVVFDDDQYYPEYIIKYSAVSRGYQQPATRAPVPRVRPARAAASQPQSSRTQTSSKPTSGLGTSLHSSGSTAAAAGYSYASNVPRYSRSTSSGPSSYSSGATNASYHSTGSASAYTSGSNLYSSSSSSTYTSRPSSSNAPTRSTSPTGTSAYSSPSSYTGTSSPYSSSASSSRSSIPRYSYPSPSETRKRSSKETKCLVM